MVSPPHDSELVRRFKTAGLIILGSTKVPELSEALADQIARIVRSIRQMELKKHPSVSETLDWARTLLLLGVESITEAEATETINILLKYQSDIAKAVREFANEQQGFKRGVGAKR